MPFTDANRFKSSQADKRELISFSMFNRIRNVKSTNVTTGTLRFLIVRLHANSNLLTQLPTIRAAIS